MISAARRISTDPSAAPPGPQARRAIPFDHAFRYELTGVPGNVINSIVTVSIEASFIAVSIGYGVVPKVQPIVFGPSSRFVPGRGQGDTNLSSINFGDVLQTLQALDPKVVAASRALSSGNGLEAVFKNGIKLNPDVAELALQNNALKDDILGRLFQLVGSPPELIQFKYAIFDEGSGREFQSEPILNIAGLGSANGERPFRYFARSITFRPRSTIRMEVTEISDFLGELHVSLHGYKVLGEPDSPTGMTQRRAGGRRR